MFSYEKQFSIIDSTEDINGKKNPGITRASLELLLH
jgi:hypothetical protein